MVKKHFEKGHSIKKLLLINWLKHLFFGLWPMVHMDKAKSQFFSIRFLDHWALSRYRRKSKKKRSGL